ncbi:MAG: collagen-like protein [Caldisericia bacterium]|nr:collagen-like protein [Caldisericia bacterium]
MQNENITCNQYDGYDDGNTPADDFSAEVIDNPSNIKLAGSFAPEEVGGVSWADQLQYHHGDIVSFECKLYTAIAANIFCPPDTTPEKWQLNEFSGREGKQGEQGSEGLQGIVGVTGQKGEEGIQGIRGVTGPRGMPVPVGPNGGLQEELKIAAMSGDIEIDAIIKVAREVKVQADLVASLVEEALQEIRRLDLELQTTINKATSESLKMIAQASDIEITKINNLP